MQTQEDTVNFCACYVSRHVRWRHFAFSNLINYFTTGNLFMMNEKRWLRWCCCHFCISAVVVVHLFFFFFISHFDENRIFVLCTIFSKHVPTPRWKHDEQHHAPNWPPIKAFIDYLIRSIFILVYFDRKRLNISKGWLRLKLDSTGLNKSFGIVHKPYTSWRVFGHSFQVR